MRGVDYWTAEDRKPIEDATLAATAAAGRADAAATTATEGEASRVAAEAERADVEAARAEAELARRAAETGRVEAEATRAANESKRTETFNSNLVSWNSKVDAAVAKAQTATDNATAAANKAEAAVSKLPLPLGNTLKGEVEATLVNVDDAYPAPLVTAKVMGQSNQQQEPAPSPENPQEITNLNKAELVVVGKNLINVSNEAVSDKAPSQTNGYMIENGVITFTSVSDWGADYIFFNEAVVLGIEKLTFSMKATKAISTAPNNGAKFLCRAYDVDGNEITVEQGLSTTEGEWTYNTYYKAYCQSVTKNLLTITLRPNIAKICFGVCYSDAQEGTNVEIKDFQIEAGSKATYYQPYQSEATRIDLKGNELQSIPNGVRDEVVIDADGNVSLIKRVAKYVVPDNVYVQDEANNFGVKLDLNAVDDKYLHRQLCPENAPYSPSVNWLSVYKKNGNWANLQEFKQWLIGTEFYYGTKNPETIPLGKVELPALPESTSNVWNNGNIPANVYINYLKDVNIAYGKLESQLSQITMALSMIDTPTVIPEI